MGDSEKRMLSLASPMAVSSLWLIIAWWWGEEACIKYIVLLLPAYLTFLFLLARKKIKNKIENCSEAWVTNTILYLGHNTQS